MAKKDPRRMVVTTSTTSIEDTYKWYVKVVCGGTEDSDNPNIFKLDEKFVTSVSYSPKTYLCEDGKDAYAFSSLGCAMDMCFAIAANGRLATVVCVPNWSQKYMNMNPEVEEGKDEE